MAITEHSIQEKMNLKTNKQPGLNCWERQRLAATGGKVENLLSPSSTLYWHRQKPYSYWGKGRNQFLPVLTQWCKVGRERGVQKTVLQPTLPMPTNIREFSCGAGRGKANLPALQNKKQKLFTSRKETDTPRKPYPEALVPKTS